MDNLEQFFLYNLYISIDELVFFFCVFNTTFYNISVILWGWKLEYPEKTTDLPQVTNFIT
jgi:hypothetical protein